MLSVLRSFVKGRLWYLSQCKDWTGLDDRDLIPGSGNDGTLLGAHRTSYAMGTGTLIPGHEADHSPRLRMHGAVLPFLQYFFLAWRLVKHRGNFTLPLKGNYHAHKRSPPDHFMTQLNSVYILLISGAF
jgi:hypothetical protein